LLNGYVIITPFRYS